MDRTFIESYAAAKGLSPEAAALEVNAIIADIAGAGAGKLGAFGPYTTEDLAQEAWLFALEALPRYDFGCPLGPFLAVHVRNRLQNLKRDKFYRAEPPCSCCDPFGEPVDPCPRWIAWRRRNSAKLGLARPGPGLAPYGEVDRSAKDDAALLREVDAWVDASLTAHQRSDWQRLKAGVPLGESRRAAVIGPILERFGGLNAP